MSEGLKVLLLRKVKKRPTPPGTRTVMQQQKQQPPLSRSFRPGFTLSQGSLATPGNISVPFGLALKMSVGTQYRYHHIAYQCENPSGDAGVTTVHPTLSALR